MTVSLPNDLASAPSFGSHRDTGPVAREMLTSSTHFLLGVSGGGENTDPTPPLQPSGCPRGQEFQLAGGIPGWEVPRLGSALCLSRAE
jgi:hypothetical protein